MKNANIDDIITRIKELCKNRGIKIGYLTSQIGVDRTYFTTLSRTSGNISDERLEQIANILGTTSEYLKGETDITDIDVDGDQNRELNEYLEQLRTRPELRMMFSLTSKATKADVEKAVRIIEALLKEDE